MQNEGKLTKSNATTTAVRTPTKTHIKFDTTTTIKNHVKSHQNESEPSTPTHYYNEVYNRPYNYHNLDKAIKRQQEQQQQQQQVEQEDKEKNNNIHTDQYSCNKRESNLNNEGIGIDNESGSVTSISSNLTKLKTFGNFPIPNNQRGSPSCDSSFTEASTTPKASAVTVMSSSYVNNYHFDTNYTFNRYMTLYQTSWDMILNVDDNTEMTDDLTVEEDQEYDSSLDSSIDTDRDHDINDNNPSSSDNDSGTLEGSKMNDKTKNSNGKEMNYRKNSTTKRKEEQCRRRDRLKKFYDSSSEVCMRLHYNYKHRYNFAAVCAMENWSRFIQFLVLFIILIYFIILSYALPSLWQYCRMLIQYSREVIKFIFET